MSDDEYKGPSPITEDRIPYSWFLDQILRQLKALNGVVKRLVEATLSDAQATSMLAEQQKLLVEAISRLSDTTVSPGSTNGKVDYSERDDLFRQIKEIRERIDEKLGKLKQDC